MKIPAHRVGIFSSFVFLHLKNICTIVFSDSLVIFVAKVKSVFGSSLRDTLF